MADATLDPAYAAHGLVSMVSHFAYHMVFFVGLGAQTAIAAAWLGRTAGWVVALLAAGMGVLYAAGVLGG